MALHYSRDGYSFLADAASLSIDPGPQLFLLKNPSTLDEPAFPRCGSLSAINRSRVTQGSQSHLA